MEVVKISLSTAIQAHGDEVKELGLRRPNVKDLRRHGFPFVMDGEGSLKFNTEAVAKYIEVLAGIPSSSVDMMTLQDFQACMAEIMSFFGGVQGT